MISIILPISEVLDGTIVRKPTGQATFEVSRGLKIYVKDGTGPNQEIKPVEGSVFLLGRSNDSIEQVAGDRLVALDFERLCDFLLGRSNASIEQVAGDRLVALDFERLCDLRDWLEAQEEMD